MSMYYTTGYSKGSLRVIVMGNWTNVRRRLAYKTVFDTTSLFVPFMPSNDNHLLYVK